MNDGAKYLKPPHNPEQIEIREPEEKLQRIENGKRHIKKATALLMSDS